MDYSPSGIMSGLDVARCLAHGAQFVFCGRAFIYGIAALGKPGGDHAVAILREGLKDILTQIGCATVEEFDARWLSVTETPTPPQAPG